MKIHHTVVDHLLNLVDQYGGFRENTKLREAFDKLDLSVYQRQKGDRDQVVVLTRDLKG